MQEISFLSSVPISFFSRWSLQAITPIDRRPRLKRTLISSFTPSSFFISVHYLCFVSCCLCLLIMFEYLFLLELVSLVFVILSLLTCWPIFAGSFMFLCLQHFYLSISLDDSIVFQWLPSLADTLDQPIVISNLFI